MSYWDLTDTVRVELGGKNPTCSIHQCEMFSIDDHGRFMCPECGLDKVHDFGGDQDLQFPLNLALCFDRKPVSSTGGFLFV